MAPDVLEGNPEAMLVPFIINFREYRQPCYTTIIKKSDFPFRKTLYYQSFMTRFHPFVGSEA
jgi:hypothetical protein